MSKTSTLVLLLSLFLVVPAAPFLAPGAADHEPLVNVSLGAAHFADFNGDDGDYNTWLSDPQPVTSWAWGAPTSGPGAAASGSNVWATNLAGSYLLKDCGAIVSPPIDLTSASSASFSLREWHHFERSSATGTQWDIGLLFVSTDDGVTWTKLTSPSPPYDSGSASTTARACLKNQPTGTGGYAGPVGTTPPPAVYSDIEASLDGFLGSNVRVAFAFGSDASIVREGWYIDDFNTTVDGVTTSEDFEADDGGFTIQEWRAPDPVTTSWEWGTPTNGPASSANADPPMWGTDIDGNRLPYECGAIESPEIDLTGVVGNGLPATKATLRWQQWFRTSTGGGVVQIGNGVNYTNIEPTTGYPSNPTSSLDWCLQDDAQETGGFSGTRNTPGADMTDYEADISGFLGQVITVRFLFASTSSTSTISQEGWYVDNVEVETAAYLAAPHLPSVAPECGAPGWMSGGEASSWCYGQVTDDSTNAPGGDTAFATNLADNHNTGECSWIEAPAVPGALLALNPTMTFEHWYRMAFAFSATTATGGVVIVSTDGGSTWQYVPSGDYVRPTNPSYPSLRNCLESYGLDPESSVFTGVKTSWDAVSLDLSAFAGAPTVQVRLLFGSHTSLAYEGWFVRNVNIGGVQALP